MKANSIGELFGTLQQSIVDEWRKHLKTSKYSKHMALDEFYTEMPELVDQLIEDYQAINGIVDDYKNVFDASTMNALEYLEELRAFIKDSRAEFIEGESELESDLDNILSMIDSTIYKVRELKENKIMSLKNYLLESLNINEAMVDVDDAVLKGFKKIDKLIGQDKLPQLFAKLNITDLDVFDEETGIDIKVVQNIIIHFIGWCLAAYDEFDDASSWFNNIVNNKEQIMDGALEEYIETYDDDYDEGTINWAYEYTVSDIIPMIYKEATHHELRLWG